MPGQKSHGPDGSACSESALQTLRVVVSNLPLDAALEIFRFLTLDEQRALGNFIFGRIVTWRKAVKHGRIPPEEIERIQNLIQAHVTAARQAARLSPHAGPEAPPKGRRAP